MPTDLQNFSTGYKGSQVRRRNRRLHEGRVYQPGVPEGSRNEGSVQRHFENRPSVVDIPAATAALHQGRVSQPGVVGHRRFGQVTTLLAPLELANRQASEGVKPDEQSIAKIYGKRAALAVNHTFVSGLHEQLGEPSDLTNAILLASGAGDIAAGLGAAGRLVASKAAGDVAADTAADAGVATAEAAGEQATKGAVRNAFDKAAAKRAAAADAVKGAVKDAEPDAVKAARQKGEAAARAFADRAPEPVKVAGKIAAKTATFPFRHPILSPIALQIPTAAIQRKPGAVEAGFTGQGNYAAILGAVGDIVSPIPLAKEAVTLPSTVIPSLYLTAKAADTAATTGNTDELGQLLGEWRKTGLLPQIAEGLTKGKWSGALEALENHPLYSGLEASGALNAAGRVAGAGLRATPGVHVADVSPRPDIEIPGTTVRVDQGNYSRDVLRKLAQKALDDSDWRTPSAGSRRGQHFQKEAASRHTVDSRRVEEVHSRQALKSLDELLPRKWHGKRIDRASADVVNLAVERVIQSPRTFSKDLPKYKDMIDKAAAATDTDGRPLLNKEELKRNRALGRTIDRAIKRAHPGHVVDAADSFIDLQKGVLQQMVDLKLISPERAEMASAIPWARVHLGAKWGEPKKLVADLTNEVKSTRRNFRREARAHLAPKDEDGREGGYVGAVRDTKRDLKTAESGYVEAERALARARTKGADESEISQRVGTRDAAKSRVAVAKQDARAATSSLRDETRSLKRKLKDRLEPLEAQLKQHRKNGERLLDEHGYPLSREDVHKAMTDRGVELPGFMTHRPPRPGDHYQPSFGGASLEKGARTGGAVLSGKQVSGIDALVRTIKRAQGLVDRAHAWNEAVTRFGIEIPGVKTMSDARRVLEDPTHYDVPDGVTLMAVPRHPFAATKDEMEGALAEQKPSGVEALIGQDTAVDAGEQAGAHLADEIDAVSKGAAPDDTPIVFFPERVGKVLRDDAQGSGGALRSAQLATNLFKRAVLPFSVSFYLGNVFDNYLRLSMSGAVNPVNFFAGYKADKALSKEREAQIVSGAHYSSFDKLAPHRTLQNVATGGSNLAQFVRQSSEWYHDPHGGFERKLVRALPTGMRRLTTFMFATNALLSERLPEMGLLGKQMREDIRATQGSWMASVKLSEDVVNDWAKGVDDPVKRAKLQKNLEQTLGNYTQLSPNARRVLSTVVPFWTWMRSAYKYVYVTMPAHRSIQTAFLAAAASTTQEEREKYGLEKFGKEPLPDYLQGAVPLPSGGIFPASRFNSFGYASEPTEAAASAFGGQFSGISEGLKGEEFGGGKFDGEGNKIVAASLGMISSFIPGANDLFETEGASISLHPHIALPHEYDKGYVQWERTPKESITIEKDPASSEEGFGGSASFGEAWANRGEESAGASFGEAWADR